MLKSMNFEWLKALWIYETFQIFEPTFVVLLDVRLRRTLLEQSLNPSKVEQNTFFLVRSWLTKTSSANAGFKSLLGG